MSASVPDQEKHPETCFVRHRVLDAPTFPSLLFLRPLYCGLLLAQDPPLITEAPNAKACGAASFHRCQKQARLRLAPYESEANLERPLVILSIW
jgi:hypothetical protein